MAKFLSLWRINPSGPWPTDPTENAGVYEMLFGAIDALLKKGEMLEFGFFQGATSGYVISTGEAKDSFRRAFSFHPFFEIEGREILSYETGKEVMRAVLKEKIEAMKQNS
ncbi:MAG: hypothetical protein ACXV5H_05275 [Halobacteriota archaeon]